MAPVIVRLSGLLEAAVHLQKPYDAVIVTKLDVPLDITETGVGVSVNVHVYAEAWSMVKTEVATELPIVMVGVIGPPVFGSTVYFTVPVPVPEAPDVTFTCEVLLEVAVHAQLLGVGVTVIDPMPPPTGAITGEVLSVK